jgi:hypothetical protein
MDTVGLTVSFFITIESLALPKEFVAEQVYVVSVVSGTVTASQPLVTGAALPVTRHVIFVEPIYQLFALWVPVTVGATVGWAKVWPGRTATAEPASSVKYSNMAPVAKYQFDAGQGSPITPVEIHGELDQ